MLQQVPTSLCGTRICMLLCCVVHAWQCAAFVGPTPQSTLQLHMDALSHFAGFNLVVGADHCRGVQLYLGHGGVSRQVRARVRV